jgi:hypothetical protein
MVQAMQGMDPFADGLSTKLQGPKARYVPPPSNLRPLTPEIFDAIFPGKSGEPRRGKGRPHGNRLGSRHQRLPREGC